MCVEANVEVERMHRFALKSGIRALGRISISSNSEKSDRTVCNDNRTSALVSHANKVLLKVILGHIRNKKLSYR